VGVLAHLVRKELLQLLQDTKMLRLALLAPAVQLLLLGYAANLDVHELPVVVVDQDHSSVSRSLVGSLAATDFFELVGVSETVEGVDPWLVTGRAQIAVVIPAGLGAAIASGGLPEVQLLVDGSDSVSASIGMGYATGVIQGALRGRATVGSASRMGRVELTSRVWYNPDLRSRWFFVPAVLAMVLMLVTLILSSMGVVREKEIGTMEQLAVTPVRPWQLIVGKLLPYALIGVVDMLVVVAIAIGWFGVPLRGSLAVLLGLTVLLLLNTLGLGLLVSTLVDTQQQAMMGSAFLVMIPMIYLSGLLFPIDNMPGVLQLVTYAVPLRYYAEILRGLFLRGSGLDVLWPQAVALAGFGVGFLGLAALRFQKRLD
jgi:ABC-2 type transport system permease protein